MFVICIVDDIDILVLKFTDDGVDPHTLHPDTRSDRNYPLIMGDHGNFRAVTRFSCNSYNVDDSVKNFRNLIFKQSFQEERGRTGDNNGRISIIEPHLHNQSTNCMPLAVAILVDLPALVHHQFDSVLVDQYIPSPDMI